MVSNLQVELAIYNFDLFYSALMDKQGGVWLLPQDDATLLLLETIEDILEKAEEEIYAMNWGAREPWERRLYGLTDADDELIEWW